MGSHLQSFEGIAGCWFSVWVPQAQRVSVIGDFNSWDSRKNPMQPLGTSGIWSCFISDVKAGDIYKYNIESIDGRILDKADPFAQWCEEPPKTGSRVFSSNHHWSDQKWLSDRKDRQASNKAMAIYELHIGSWRRRPEEANRSLTYREMAKELPNYLNELGFTHVEFLPIMEHPFYGSWGYQTTGYFAPTSRYGTPDDFRFLVDTLHQAGIGVILDWVPSHFPSDEFALAAYNGGALFEHADPRLGYHPEWKSLIFDYGRREVRSFLISSALYWLQEFHIDGLRVDAVASMVYLDYSRKEGEWRPNVYGGHENLEAVHFLQELNESVYRAFPDVHVIAEESTAWPKVSAPVDQGGLGFGMKWDMGWMHDTFEYFKKDPIYRKYHQNDLSFRMIYAFSENFVLSVSHDEVVYGKGSVINKMSGDDWQKFANLRAFYSYMYAMPGKKLLFMGCEFAQTAEWNHEASLDWQLLKNSKPHQGIALLVGDLNRLYSRFPALHELDFSAQGFNWIDAQDAENSVYAFIRQSASGEKILCVFNLTAIVQSNYRIGVPVAGYWQELLNTDATTYGGSGVGNLGGISAEAISAHGHGSSLNLTLPPLAALFLKVGPPA